MKRVIAYVACSYLVNWYVLNHWSTFFFSDHEPTHAEKSIMLLISPVMLPVEIFVEIASVAGKLCERLV